MRGWRRWGRILAVVAASCAAPPDEVDVDATDAPDAVEDTEVDAPSDSEPIDTEPGDSDGAGDTDAPGDTDTDGAADTDTDGAADTDTDTPGDTEPTDLPPSTPVVTFEPAAPTTSSGVQAVIDAPSVDPEGATVTYAWSWTVDGTPVPEVDADVVPPGLSRRGETWSVRVLPSDGTRAGAPGTASVVVGNAAPELALAWAVPAPTGDDDLVVETWTDDADGDAVSLSWTWRRDGADTGVVGASVPASSTHPGETWAVAVVADDHHGGTASSTIEVTVVDRGPTIRSLVAAPDPAPVGAALTASLVADDPDGDPLATAWSWSVDGVPTAFADARVPGGVTEDGQTWTVVAEVSDGHGGTARASADLVVENHAPTVALTLLPDAPQPRVDLVADVQVADADHDACTVTYAWTEDGAPTAFTTDTVPGDALSHLAVWQVEVTVDDGHGHVVVRTAEAVVILPPPEITDVIVSPDRPADEHPLVAEVWVLASLGDDVRVSSYRWFRDGEVVPFATGRTVASDLTTPGETWVVEAVVEDAYASAGPVRSAPVTIGPAIAPKVVITPVHPVDADDLVAEVVTASEPPYPLTVVYDWFRWPSTYVDGPRVDSASTVVGDDWFVSAAVTDDEGLYLTDVEVAHVGAYRVREDTVLLVDLSPGEVSVPEIAPALTGFVADLAARVTADELQEVALVGFAGSAQPFDLERDGGWLDAASLDDDYVGPYAYGSWRWLGADVVASDDEVLAGLQGCYVGMDAWYHLIRYDLDDPGTTAATPAYRVAGPTSSADPRPRLLLHPAVPRDAAMLGYLDAFATSTLPACAGHAPAGTVCPYFTSLATSGAVLSKSDQCWAWLVSEWVFALVDPRRADVATYGRRSPLACDGRSGWDSFPGDVWTGVHPVVAVDCGFADDPGFAGGAPSFGSPDGALLSPDVSYGAAGARLDLGLERASWDLDAADHPTAARVVVLMRSAPGCGPWTDDGGACDATVRADVEVAIAALVAVGVEVDVLGLVEAGSDAEATLAGLADVGATYLTVTPDGLAGALADLAR